MAVNHKLTQLLKIVSSSFRLNASEARRNDRRSGQRCDPSGQEQSGRVSGLSCGLRKRRSKRVMILDLSRIASALDQQSGVG